MTMPPMDSIGSQLWMNIGDVFYIKGRGTVVTGRLEGAGQLSVGDTLVCEGEHWPVGGIEKFRAVLTTAEPGSDIGVLLKNGPAAEMLRGKMVQFVSGAASGSTNSQLTRRAKKLGRWRG